MPLTMMEWVYGISQIAAVFLSVVAGILSTVLMRQSRGQDMLAAWKWLSISLVLFAVEELLGIFRTFNIYNYPDLWLPEGVHLFLTKAVTHIIPFFILLFICIALIKQANIKKGWFG